MNQITIDQADYQRLLTAVGKMTEQLNAVQTLARNHAHPGCSPGAHELACRILRALGDERYQEEAK